MKEALPDLDRFFAENRLERRRENLGDLLTGMLRERGMTKAELSKRSGTSDGYLCEIFRGRKRPSRNRLLCLCIGFGLSVEESQAMLHRCGYEKLYLKRKRDVLISQCIREGCDVFQANERLFDEHMQMLW